MSMLRRLLGAKIKLELPHGHELDQARRVVARPDAPNDEREAAIIQAAQQAIPYATSLNPADVLAYQRFAKSYEPLGAPAKARHDWAPGVAKARIDLANDGPQPTMLARPVGLNFPQLKAIVKSDPVLKAIIFTRIGQMLHFLRRQRNPKLPGYRLKFRNPNRLILPEDTERFFYLEQYLENCGAEFDPRRRRARKRDNFRDFTTRHLQSSLTMDAAPVELVRTPSGRTHGFVHVDGGNVFLADANYGVNDTDNPPDSYARYGFEVPNTDEVIAILADQGRPVNWYTHDELLYPVRRPDPDGQHYGYGQPEPEDLLSVVTGFLNAMTLTARSISHNAIPQGLITMFGDFTEADLEQFRREWDAYVTGVSNRFRLPIMVSQDRESGATFVPTGAAVEEMMFARWITLLTTIKCSLYQMDPSEISFDGFSVQSSSLSGSDTEERLASSKDKGLYSTLDFYGATLNEILQTVDPDVALEWTGMTPDQATRDADEALTLTWKEYRAERGLEAPEDPIMADAPMNPTLMGLYQGNIQAKQQQELMAQQQAMQPQAQPGADGQIAETTDAGQRQLQDHEGGVWGVAPHDGQQPQPGQAGQPVMAKADTRAGAADTRAGSKAATTDLDLWP